MKMLRSKLTRALPIVALLALGTCALAQEQAPPAWEDVRAQVEEGLLLRKVDEVIDLCTRVLVGAPECAEALLARAQAAEQRWRFDMALRDYTASIEADPTLIEAWLGRALVYDRYDDEDAREADLQRALELCTDRIADDPEDAEAYLFRGLAIVRRGDSPLPAVDDWEEALRLAPEDYRMHQWMARVAEFRDGLSEALACLDRALELEPRAMRVRELRAMTLWALGSTDEALQAWDEMLELNPDDPMIHWMRGLQLSRADSEAALAEYVRAVEIDPGFWPPLELRGHARSRAGDHEGAIADLTRAIEIQEEMGLSP